MALLQQPIQRKLSALLGAEVTFEKLNLSLLSGTIEALGVVVAGEDRATPVLTIARVRAEVAVGRALKGEIVVRSLTVERPVVTIIRRADGTTNLPKRIATEPAEPTTPAAPGPAAPAREEENEKSSWKLDAERVLVVDGEIHVHVGADHLLAKPLLAELKRAGGGYAVTLLIDSVGRAGDASTAISTRGNGTIHNAADLTAVPQSPAELNVELGDVAKVKLTTPSAASRVLQLTASGAADAARLLALIPPAIVPAALSQLRGRIEFSAAAQLDPAAGLRVSELALRASDMILPLSQADVSR